MAYVESHVLLAAHGGLPSGEVWSCGMRLGGDGGLVWTQDMLEAVALAAANSWRTFQNTASIGWASGVSLDGVTARAVDTNGITRVLAERSPAAAPGTFGTLYLPNQAAVVVTLITTKPGRTGKGRIYLPLLGLSLGTTGRISSTTVTNVANAARTLVQGINTGVATALTGGAPIPKVAVQSQVAGSGATAMVTGLRVGDIVDTQRRRRDSVAETYTSVTV